MAFAIYFIRFASFSGCHLPPIEFLDEQVIGEYSIVR